MKPRPLSTRALVLFAGFIILLNLILHFTHQASSFSYIRSMLTAKGGDDSWHVMFPALDVAAAGERGIYSQVFFLKHIKYIDPPTALLLPWFLQKLQPQSGHFEIQEELNFVGWAATWGFIFISIVILIGPMKDQDSAESGGGFAKFFASKEKWVWAIAALVLGVLTYPASLAVRLGQTQPSVTLMFAVALWLRLRGSKGLAGAALGIAALIKPPYLLFLVWSALRRERSFLQGFSCTYATGLILSILIFGLQAHYEYIAVGHYVSQRGESLYANQSVNGLLNRLVQPEESRGWKRYEYPPYNPIVHIGTLINAILMIGLAYFLPRPEQRGNILDFAGMALVTILAAPLAWEHNYAMLLPVFALLLRQGSFSPLAIAVSYIFVATPFQILSSISNPPWNILMSYVLFGALLCAFMIYRKLANKEKEPIRLENSLGVAPVSVPVQ